MSEYGPDWDFLGTDAGEILRAADRLRRAREVAEWAMRSGDPARMRAALAELEAANETAQAKDPHQE